MSLDLMLSEEFLGPQALPLPVIFARLFGAALLCGFVGYEREASDKGAGLKTHMLLGLAAAMFALVTIHIVEIYAAEPFGGPDSVIRLDPLRLVEAATAGVAFLAAGMIFLKRGEVRNLTTGAVMWLTASIGLAVGFGLWPLAVFGVLLDLLIVVLVRRIEHGARR